MGNSERGFTLIELVVATVIILGLLLTALFTLRTNTYTPINQDSQRRTNVARIVQALNRYVADNGHFPEAVPSKLTAIGSGSGHYDLCKYLVPKYIPDLPMDPAYGVRMARNGSPSFDNCRTPGLTYGSGFGIQRLPTGVVAVVSPLTNNQEISIPVPDSESIQ